MHSYFGTDLPMWTILFFLSLTLAGFVYLVDHYSKGRRRKANSLLYVHPSNALIEQALPMEMFELILGSLDLPAYYKCKSVSKYWKQCLETKYVKDMVLENEGFYPLDSHISIDELRQDFTEVETNPDDNISWLPYAGHYKEEHHIQDQYIAKQYGKRLIDALPSSLITIKNALGCNLNGTEPGNATKYMAKLRVVTNRFTDTHWIFASGGSFIQVPISSLKPEWIWKEESTVEILADLQYINRIWTKLPRIYQYRCIQRESRQLFNLLPVNSDIFYLMYMLLLPCIYVDVSTYVAKPLTESLKYLLCNLCLLAILGLSTFISFDAIYVTKGRNKRTIFWVVSLFGYYAVAVWKLGEYLIAYAEFIVILMSLIMYLMMHDNYRSYTPHKHIAYIVFVASTCLFLLANDWHVVLSAINSGIFLETFKMNFIISALVNINLAFARLITNSSQERRTEKEIYLRLVIFLAVIVCTVYHPMSAATKLIK